MHTKTIGLLAASLLACGSITFTASAAEPTTSEEPSAHPFYRPLTLGVEGGLPGVGGSVSWRFAEHLGVRTGFDYWQYSESSLDIKALKYDAKLRFMSEPLTLDIYPWKKHSFHISVGMLFNQNRLTGTASGNETIIPDERLGTLKLNVEQQPVNPYLSIGGNFFYFDRAHHWAMGGELGVFYTGDPKVSLTRSDGRSSALSDAVLQAEEKRITDYANKFRWMPVVKLNVSYSF